MNEQVVEAAVETTLKPTADLKKEADHVIRRHTLFAAGAGLIPIPVLDTAAILGIQVTMLRSISQLYHIEFRENVVRSVISSLISSVGAVSIAKAIPGLGTVLGGVTLSAAASASTYALGKVFIQHFDQGGTLLDFDPVKSRDYFAKEFEAGRMYASDVTEVEKEVVKKKKISKGKEVSGSITNFIHVLNGKKKKQEEAERLETLQTNKELLATVAQLQEEIAGMKKN